MKVKTSYNYELIEDYLDGILASKSALKVKKLIATDEEARAIADGILMLRGHFKEDKKVDTYMNDRLVKTQEVIEQNLAVKKSGMWLKIAASIALIFTVGLSTYVFTKDSLQDLVAGQLKEPYQAVITTRGSETTGSIQRGLLAYNNAAYEQSIEELATQDTPQAVFFSGLSYLYLDKMETAIQLLKSHKLKDSRYEEQTRWYLTVAYLKLGNMAQGEKLLLQIKSREKHFKQKEAREILEFLDM